MVVVIAGASFVFFALSHAMPGDAIRGLFVRSPPPPEVYEALRTRYGLDDPFVIQYFKFTANALRGDFGYSFRGGTVREIIASGLPVTLRLMAAALIAQVTIGITSGLIASLTRKRFLRVLIQVATILALSIPAQVLAYALQIAGDELPYLPTLSLYEGWRAYILPGIALAAGLTAYVARMVESELNVVLREPFVKAAEAKGLSERRVIGIHALRVALPAAVTLIAASVSQIVAAVILVEAVFHLPGVGWQVLMAARTRDYNVLVGILTVTVFFVILASFAADTLHAVIDPRVKLGPRRQTAG